MSSGFLDQQFSIFHFKLLLAFHYVVISFYRSLLYTPVCISGVLWGMKKVGVVFPIWAEEMASATRIQGIQGSRLQSKFSTAAHSLLNVPTLNTHTEGKLYEGRTLFNLCFSCSISNVHSTECGQLSQCLWMLKQKINPEG